MNYDEGDKPWKDDGSTVTENPNDNFFDRCMETI